MATGSDKREMAPTHVLVPVLAITVMGAILATAVSLALIVHHTFAVVLLIPLAIGIVGGLLGWMLAIPLGAQRTALAGAMGLSLAIGAHIAHLHVLYRLQVSGADVPPSWWAHLHEQAAGGLILARRPGGDGIGLGTRGYWVVGFVELTLAAAIGALVGSRLEVDQPTKRSPRG